MTGTVTCVGIAVEDTVFELGSPISVGQKNFATSQRIATGGPATNAAAAIASLGGSPRLVSRIGSDRIGDSIVADLRSHQVDTSGVRRVPGVPSPTSAVFLDRDGERTIVNYTDERLFDNGDSVSIEDLSDSDAVLVDLRWPSGAMTAIKHANTLGIPSIVDFDLTTGEPHDDIIACASHVIFSHPALTRLTQLEDIDDALNSVAAVTEAFVGVTLGRKGFLWIEDGSMSTFPGYEVDVVDTLGAGDVFHGAFALGLARGMTVGELVPWSSAAAALKCTRRGGRSAFPNSDDVASFLEGARS